KRLQKKNRRRHYRRRQHGSRRPFGGATRRSIALSGRYSPLSLFRSSSQELSRSVQPQRQRTCTKQRQHLASDERWQPGHAILMLANSRHSRYKSTDDLVRHKQRYIGTIEKRACHAPEDDLA